jgi:hypothetical protein
MKALYTVFLVYFSPVLFKDNGKQVIVEKGTRLARRRKAGVNLPMYGIVAFLKKKDQR